MLTASALFGIASTVVAAEPLRVSRRTITISVSVAPRITVSRDGQMCTNLAADQVTVMTGQEQVPLSRPADGEHDRCPGSLQPLATTVSDLGQGLIIISAN